MKKLVVFLISFNLKIFSTKISHWKIKIHFKKWNFLTGTETRLNLVCSQTFQVCLQGLLTLGSTSEMTDQIIYWALTHRRWKNWQPITAPHKDCCLMYRREINHVHKICTSWILIKKDKLEKACFNMRVEPLRGNQNFKSLVTQRAVPPTRHTDPRSFSIWLLIRCVNDSFYVSVWEALCWSNDSQLCPIELPRKFNTDTCSLSPDNPF